MRLANKIAVVTGAASGIGKAAAERFVNEGASVILADINLEEAVLLEHRLNDYRQSAVCHAVRCDVANPGDVSQLMRECIDTFHRIDILFNNAGTEFQSTVPETGFEDWNRVIGVNLSGVFLCAKHAIPYMQRQGGGVIINTASQLGLVGSQNWAAYGASKAGVINLTRTLALDHAKDNIRVNAICPGPIDTPLTNRLEAKLTGDERNQFYQDLYSSVPMGRLGTAEEIASCVAFLASDDATYMTGSVLVVDGGYTAR